MRLTRRGLLLCVALSALPGCAGGQAARNSSASTNFQRADTAALHRTLDSLASAHRGVVGYVVHNLDTGERLELRGDETFPTASLIKVAVLVTV
ncbi:MAG: putative beta-lactamase precursor, partial [Gemmatimonadetes bacterium]|nr:putative beta-lactamase precursor [Gemmatimonadota bacterium]